MSTPDHFLNCVLATVDDQAMTKSRKKGYYKLQLEAAQNFYSSMVNLNISLGKSRPFDVESKFGGCVYSYAQAIESRHNVTPFKTMDLAIGECKSSLTELYQAFYDHAMTSHHMAKTKYEKSRQLHIAENVKLAITEHQNRESNKE